MLLLEDASSSQFSKVSTMPTTPAPPRGFEDLAGAASSPSRGLIGLPLPPRPAPAISFDEIYKYLILRRMSDQAVGTLVVTKDGSL